MPGPWLFIDLDGARDIVARISIRSCLCFFPSLLLMRGARDEEDGKEIRRLLTTAFARVP